MLSQHAQSRPSLGGGREGDIDYELLSLASEATAPNARNLRVRFQEWLRGVGASPALVDDLGLAVYEALANVVEHAYPPDHPEPVMCLKALRDGDHLLIMVADRGRWRGPQEPQETGYRGRGLAVMRCFAREVDVHPTSQGTAVWLRALLGSAR